MPAKSPAQKRLMDAAAHNPAFAKKVGIPSKVAKEFSKESKGMTFQKGGEMKKDSKAMAKKEIAFMQKKGAPKSMIKHEKAEYGMKSGGKAKKMFNGGPADPLAAQRALATPTNAPSIGPQARLTPASMRPPGVKEAPGRPMSSAAAGPKTRTMKDGGKAYARGGGIEAKGKTKGKMVKMMGGGRAC